MLDYLTGAEEVNHSLMSDLFREFDGKMVKMLSSGKSFILGVGDGNGAVGDWSVYPMNSILGQPFFFYTGTPSIVDNIAGFNSLSYNHGPFTAAAAAVPVSYIDVTGQIAYVANIYDTFGSTYYDLINRSYLDDKTSNYLSFFDYSLEAHKISGNYIAEKLGSTYFPGSDYHLPERHLKYGLADVFCENLSQLTWETEWNKYKCLRFHNFNSTGRLYLTFEETSQNFILDPFDCRSFRNYSGVWDQSPFRYFQDYRSGDPISYAYWPKSFAGKPWGKSSLFYHPKSRNSQSANNLLNPSILLNYVDLFGYRNGAITEDERALGDYPAGLNAFFHFMHEEDGVDITNLYCINQPNYFSGSYNSGNFSHAITSTGYYQYQQDLLFPSGASNIDLIIKFPRASQAVTVDMAPVSNYGPGTVNCYAKYESSDDWLRLFSATTTGWVAGQRKSLYLTNNRPFKEYKFKLNGFEESHLSFGLQGLELHGLFDDPRIDSSIIGNLFYHRGEVMKAKVSKTLKCFDNFTPQTTFERITFNGLDKLTDWQLEHQINVTEQPNGQYYLTNADPDNYVDLIPISTNLFKVGGYDYSVVSGFMPLSLDNGITIDNHIFEYNAVNGDWGSSTYPGKANHLGFSVLNETKPPVIFATLSLTQNSATGAYVYGVWGDDFTWPAWQSNTGYLYGARVSKNKQRYQNLLDDTLNTLNTGDPAGKAYNQSNDWRNVVYAEPYDAAYAGYLNHYYARSGQIFTYSGGDVNPANGISFYEASHAGNIEWKWDDFYANYHKDIWTISGTSVTSTWGTQYTGLINLNSDTVSLLKLPEIYGFSGNGLNSISSPSLKFEPEGLTFNCDEVLTLPQGVQISFNEDQYGKFFGPFIGSGNSLTRKRKNWFRGNGFGYMSDYLFGAFNWIGPNAHSYFSSPRFPRPYNQINSDEVSDFFNLISGDLSRVSGLDFEVKRNESPTLISDIQVLHNFNPLISTQTAARAKEGNLYNQSTEHNFYYYKNDSRIENVLFDKNSLDLNSGEGFWYGAFRPDTYPLGTITPIGIDGAFPENLYLGLNRRFYVPLMSEHYNLLAQSSNQCKYADPLALENFIYWTYSGASFQIRKYTDSLINLYSVYNYDGPDIGMGTAFHEGATNITYFDVFLWGNNHTKILPKDYFIGFNENGSRHGSFFKQFFTELFSEIGVGGVKSSNDFPQEFFDISTGDIGQKKFLSNQLAFTFTGKTPTPLNTLGSSDAVRAYYKFTDIPVQKTINIASQVYTGDFYNYIDDNFSNFNWVDFNDWNAALNQLGLNIPLMDCYLPIKFEKLPISVTDSREENYGPETDLVIPGYRSLFDGSPVTLVTTIPTGFADASNLDGNFLDFTAYSGYPVYSSGFNFNGFLGETQKLYDGVLTPAHLWVHSPAMATGYYDKYTVGSIFESEYHLLSGSGPYNYYYFRPLSLYLLGPDATITIEFAETFYPESGGDSQKYGMTISMDLNCSGFSNIGGEEAVVPPVGKYTSTYYDNLYHPVISSSGEAKVYNYSAIQGAYLGNDLVKTKETYDIDAYSTYNIINEICDLPLAQSDYDVGYRQLAYTPTNPEDIIEPLSINNDAFLGGDNVTYSKPELTPFIYGSEFICDDNYKKITQQDFRFNYQWGYHHDYFWELNYRNSSPNLAIKYKPSGVFTYLKDKPLTTQGNYLKKNYGGYLADAGSDYVKIDIEYPVITSGNPSSSVIQRVNSSPFIIQAPGSGVWQVELLSDRTIDV